MSHGLIRLCDVVDASIQTLCRVIIYITTLLLFLILATNVFLRYLSGSSLSWAGELPELMFPWLVMAGVVLAAQYGSHIAISWFLDRIPVPARRVIVVLNCFILMAAYTALAWGTYTLMPIVSTERTQVLQVPSSVTYSCMLAAFVLMVVTSLSQAIRLVITKGSEAPKTLFGQAPSGH